MPSKAFDNLLRFLKSLPADEGLTLQQRRNVFENLASQFPVAEDISFEPVKVGLLQGEWINPPRPSDGGVILYLHGGGYCEGSINTHHAMVSHMAKAASTRALMMDYRLAPESPFPAAVEDSTLAYRWLLDQGLAPDGIIVAGDSAGGGLAVATLVALKDASVPLPAAAVLLSPWVDLELTGTSMTTKALEDPIVQKNIVSEMAKAYLGGHDARTPLASPLYADLKGLPPMLIQVGTSEVLLDDSIRLSDGAKASGVEVTLEEWQEMVHVWHFFVSMLPEAREAIEVIGAFIHKHIG